MFRPKTNHGTDRAAPLVVATAAAIGLGIWLGGCTQADQYLDRRETVSLGAGDAIAANQATQVVDPWPAYSGDKNLTFNGQKMQSAVERYRTGKVAAPVDPMNLETTNDSGGAVNQTTVNTGGSSSGSGASASSGSSGQ
jgi:hypothetical protein